jgi:hydroxyquinol 1,2-dioxygenase
LDSDAVFGVKQSLIRPFVLRRTEVAPDGSKMTSAWRHLRYGFALKPLASGS